MKANEVKLSRFLSQPDTQFIIPVYQRNYDWTTPQCQQLLQDIRKAGTEDTANSHFIGSIVYIHDDIYSSTGIRELTIIDGQQRLTTITLIYLVLLSIAKEQQNQQLVNRIEETYLINKFAQPEKLKLRPTENNDKVLKQLLQANGSEPTYNGFSKLEVNFRYFKNQINQVDAAVIQRGLDKLIFVEISLERGKDDPQRIFESLNSTGLALSQGDLIRNYILMGLKPNDQRRIYERYWSPIEAIARSESSEQERVSEFMRDFLTMENREIPNKGKVYQDFKAKYPFAHIDDLERTLDKMQRFAQYYHKLLNPPKEPDRDISRQLEWVSKLEVNVAFPFLMEVYDDYHNKRISKGEFMEVLELVQSFTWRRFVIGLPTNALNKIFMRLYEDVQITAYLPSLYRSLQKKRGTQRFPKDAEIIVTLKERDMYNIRTSNRSYFFERLENHENREPVQIDGNPDITVEHIFPQHPDNQWKQELEEEEYQLLLETYLHTIANLTLSGNNGRLGNKSFPEKRDMNVEGKEQGYKFSRLWLNKDLAGMDRWNKEAMEQRFERIKIRFLQIWKYPIVSVEESTEDEVSIFDAEDPKHKKLEYAIFLNKKIMVREVSKLYDYVLTTLFDKNPDVFFLPEVANKLSLTLEESALRQPSKISDAYYIESNLDSRSKFERMKLLLRLFEMEEELIIKYENFAS